MYSLGLMLLSLQDSTNENSIAAVPAPRFEWVPYQVFLPTTGLLMSLSWGLLSIGNMLFGIPHEKWTLS